MTRATLVNLGLYLASAVVYIVIGVFVTEFMLNVFVAIAFLAVTVWLVPAAVRRLR
jgi:hypothetical protein